MNHITPLNFEGMTVRIIAMDGSPRFVLADVCHVLEIGNNRDAASRLDDDEKGVGIIDTPGGEQQLTIINESGLYSLILTSRKPAAKRFKKWVTAKVLPSIRKTGSYTMGAKDETDSAPAEQPFHQRLGAVRTGTHLWGKEAGRQFWVEMNLPIVPGMRLPPRQRDLFRKPSEEGGKGEDDPEKGDGGGSDGDA
ncbi:BRO-N domain-containing protein [Azospirillum tabaci]|uniref:BRO-N domain-containing protein n=1 Tax=Azospirillum tabaci TaxID=2752310 RepID=UPI001660FD80|nr:Bro-N domain-containing protein [Azospirillum tabaci]